MCEFWKVRNIMRTLNDDTLGLMIPVNGYKAIKSDDYLKVFPINSSEDLWERINFLTEVIKSLRYERDILIHENLRLVGKSSWKDVK